MIEIMIKKVSENDYLHLASFFERNNNPQTLKYFNPFPLSKETAKKITKTRTENRYYVAYVGEIIVGFSMLRGWDEGFDVPSFGLLVDKDYWNRGIGTRLLKFSLDDAKKIGCKKVRLSVYENNRNAIHLYSSMKFKEIGRKEVFVDGMLDFKIIMVYDYPL